MSIVLYNYKSKLIKLEALAILIIASMTLSGCLKTAQNNKDTDVKGAVDSVEQAEPTNNTSQDNNMIQKQNNSTKTYSSASAMTIDVDKVYVATMKTTKGDIKLELDAKNTPNTVNNFVFLARDNFYNGVIFHRVIADFMAQGGDPTGTGMGGPGYEFADEISDSNKNIRGTIAMANAGPNTNGSQFFINVVDNSYLDARHTVFGKVVEGMEVVDALVSVDINDQDRPLEDIVINEVTIEEK